MDSPAYSVPGMRGITQLSPTPGSVITLGHSANVPLIRASSELSYRLEPHDHICSAVHAACSRDAGHGDQLGGEEVYPGWCWEGGTGRVYTGY